MVSVNGLARLNYHVTGANLQIDHVHVYIVLFCSHAIVCNVLNVISKQMTGCNMHETCVTEAFVCINGVTLNTIEPVM